MQYYRVRNWERFQHYKDRNPPWIKLHFEILTSPDWVMLADASKLLAVVCMLVASRNEGKVPADPHYFKRVAYLDKLPDLTPLIESGFLEKLQAPASESKRSQAVVRPETETESEREGENNVPRSTVAPRAKADPPRPTAPPQPSSPPEKVNNLPLDAIVKQPTYHAVKFHPRYDEVRRYIVYRLPHLDRANATEVNRWLLEGADPEKDIFPTVDSAIEMRRGDIGSFRYFTRAVESSKAVRREMAEQHERLMQKYGEEDQRAKERAAHGEAG